MPQLTYFILCTELHVARMQKNFCRSWRHHIKDWAGSFWSLYALEKERFTTWYFITVLWQWFSNFWFARLHILHWPIHLYQYISCGLWPIKVLL